MDDKGMDELRGLWAEVGVIHKDQEALAPAFGVDVRIRPKRLFKALYATIKAIIAVKTAGATAGSPGEGFGVVAEVADACKSFLRVFYERVTELSYVVAVYLGGNSGPVPISEITAKLPAYMDDLEKAYGEGALPWYLRLTRERIQAAREQLTLKLLERDLGFMREQGLVSLSGETVEAIEKVWTFRGDWG
jgi:hypothetical protein